MPSSLLPSSFTASLPLNKHTFADHSDIYPRTLGLYFPISVRTFVRVRAFLNEVLSGVDTVGGPILCAGSDLAVARGRSN